MSIDQLQAEFWEATERRKRRLPTHPAVEAFAKPKVDLACREIERICGSSVRDLTALDIGAGNGFFTHYLSDRFARVAALDFSRTMLSTNPARLKCQGDATRLPFRDASFDVVLCSNLLHHVPAPINAVSEMARIARLSVVLSEPNRNNPLMFLFALLKKEERMALRFTSGYLESLIRSATPQLGVSLRTTEGCVVPNKMPVRALPLVSALAPFFHPRFYALCVASKGV